MTTSEYIWEDSHAPSVPFSAKSVYNLNTEAEEGLQAPAASQWPRVDAPSGDTDVHYDLREHEHTQQHLSSLAPQYVEGNSPLPSRTDEEIKEPGSNVRSYVITKSRGGDLRSIAQPHKRAHQKSTHATPSTETNESSDNSKENDEAAKSVPSSKTTSSRLLETDPFGNPWPTAPPPITTKWLPPPSLEDLLKIAAPKVKATPISGGFVKPDGTHFVLDGKITYFAGAISLACPSNDLQVCILAFPKRNPNGINVCLNCGKDFSVRNCRL